MIVLRNVEDVDIPLLASWMERGDIKNEYGDPDDWVAELEQRNGEFDFVKFFVAMDGDRAVGFGQFYDCHLGGEDWYDVPIAGDTFSVGFFVGEEQDLRKGFGKAILQELLLELNRTTSAKQVIVRTQKIGAIRTLRACGFTKDEKKGYFSLRLY